MKSMGITTTVTDTRLAAASVALALLASGARASAQNNYQSYPIGGRATGMGGAYTAIADDSAGAYYNPAGPAFAVGDSLSVSTNLYGLVGGRSVGAFGRGVDFSYSGVNIIPSAASSLSHLGASSREHPSRWVFVFNVFAPQTFQLNERSVLNNGATTLFSSWDESTLLAGPSLSLRLSDRLAVGIAAFGAYHSLTTRSDITDTFSGAPMGTASDFIQATSNHSQSDIGVVLSAGVRWEPVPGLQLGLSLRSPTIHIYGSGSAFNRVAVVFPSAGMVPSVTSHVDDVETRSVLPMRIGVGAAWVRRGRFAIAADLSVYLPVTYDAIVSTRDPSLNVTVEHDAVVNGALGIEYYLLPTLPVHAGVFTDLSPVPPPSLGGSTEDHVNLVGATLGVGKYSEHTSTQLGLVGSFGGVRSLGVDLSSGSYDTVLTQGTQWRLYVVLSGSYNF